MTESREEPEDPDLSAMAGDVGVVTEFDRLSMAFTDGIASVPFAGPVIAAVFRQLLPQDVLIYLHDYAVEAARRIERLEAWGRADPGHLHSDEFREDLELILDAQTHLVQRRKREHYLAALTNSAAKDRPDLHERRRMIDLLIRLRPSHLSLLAVVAGATKLESTGDRAVDLLYRALPDVPEEVIQLDWRDLAGDGLLGGWPQGLVNTPPPQHVRAQLQPFGEKFLRFLEEQED